MARLRARNLARPQPAGDIIAAASRIEPNTARMCLTVFHEASPFAFAFRKLWTLSLVINRSCLSPKTGMRCVLTMLS